MRHNGKVTINPQQSKATDYFYDATDGEVYYDLEPCPEEYAYFKDDKEEEYYVNDEPKLDLFLFLSMQAAERLYLICKSRPLTETLLVE